VSDVQMMVGTMGFFFVVFCVGLCCRKAPKQRRIQGENDVRETSVQDSGRVGGDNLHNGDEQPVCVPRIPASQDNDSMSPTVVAPPAALSLNNWQEYQPIINEFFEGVMALVQADAAHSGSRPTAPDYWLDRYKVAAADFQALRAENTELRKQIVSLTEWKESAMRQLSKSEKLKAILPSKYLGWDVYEATVDYVVSLTQELAAERNHLKNAVDLWNAAKERPSCMELDKAEQQ
jgi:hypothetical protein